MTRRDPVESPSLSSEHGPDVGKKGIVAARVSSHAVYVRGRSVEFVPVRILQTDTEVQPWPKGWAAVAEWEIGKLEDVASAIRATSKGAIKRRISRAANRDPTGGKAPRAVIDIGDRGIQRSQLVVGIVGESERLARARVMVLMYPSETGSDRVGITEILVLGIDANIGEGIGASCGHPRRENLRCQPKCADFP